MKVIQTLAVIALGATLTLLDATAVELDTQGKTEAELNSEMVIRCQYQMGEFGNAAVTVCIESEREARKLLAEYPDEFADIVRRCNRVMYKAGWTMVKSCSDRDIAARDALIAYHDKHAATIGNCRDKVGRYGHFEVKKCVDKRIGEPGEIGER